MEFISKKNNVLLKEPTQPLFFLLTCESFAIIFYLEHVKMKEMYVKLLKIIKQFSGMQLTVKQ